MSTYTHPQQVRDFNNVVDIIGAIHAIILRERTVWSFIAAPGFFDQDLYEIAARQNVVIVRITRLPDWRKEVHLAPRTQ